ncbi:mucin-7-like [Salvia splendens]|uniref:mucin-7-like n=1 Tax=Salvia splendens TaxID=180675 RepID=UPI001C25428B|nr:mucin-7-like [Salvia splendens]
MLIEQIPTSSSSSSARTDSDNQEASSQAQIENPGPSSSPPPQTSAAQPPEVDEEAIRNLDRILQSMPSDTDIPTVYATIKARLGISMSRDRATTSTPQNPPKNPPKNPPSSSQTPALRHTPTPTPGFPLVQYSGDDSDEEEAQPAATPVAETEAVPAQPHAEGTTTPKTPTPPSGGSSNSRTLLGPTQPIEVVNIDDDSTEDLLPPPNEILQQKMAEWNFITHAED